MLCMRKQELGRGSAYIRTWFEIPTGALKGRKIESNMASTKVSRHDSYLT